MVINMKSEILRILRTAGEECVSGQRLCEIFGVSRQAVWKNISQLKEKGFEIESVSNKGYKLISEPDLLNSSAIESYLSKECICKKVEAFETVDSTNTKAKQLAELGEEEGTLIISDEQTAGKGRRGRSWCSKKGANVFMTLLIRPRIEPKYLSGITLLAAMSVATAIKDICDTEAKIKWPNDIVINKKKICGILTEMSSEMNYVNYAVIGIGINVNDDEIPQEIRKNASSIYLETDRKVNRKITKSSSPSAIMEPICWSPPKGPLFIRMMSSPVSAIIKEPVVPVANSLCSFKTSLYLIASLIMSSFFLSCAMRAIFTSFTSFLLFN